MKKYLSITLLLVLLTSCMSTKTVTYFQNKEEIDQTISKQLYDAKIMPKDILQIQVFSMTPEASDPFNLNKKSGSAVTTTTTTNQNSVYNYLVDNDGMIEMPIIGNLKLGGLSKNEAEELIKGKILPFMAESENVVVHVRMMNYKYAVLGGVRSPGLYTTQNEKVSILEAIAQAGDLTTFAYRDRIYLIRENSDGQKEFHQLNINDANIIEDFLEEDIPPVQNPDLWKAGIIVTQLADADYVYFADGWKLDSHCVFIYNICKKNNIKIIKE